MSENNMNLDLKKLGQYLEEQQLALLEKSVQGLDGQGKNAFRLCGVGFCDLAPGFELWLDSDMIVSIAAGSSIATALAVLIPDPIVCKIIAVFLGTLSAVIGKFSSEGRGLFIRGMFIPIIPYIAPINVSYQ